MTQLYTKVKLYLEDNSKTWEEENSNIQLMTRDKIQFINRWEVSGLDEPTDAQLNALESEATTLESNNQVDSTRRTAYGSEELKYGISIKSR
jgi:hypothetical protein